MKAAIAEHAGSIFGALWRSDDLVMLLAPLAEGEDQPRVLAVNAAAERHAAASFGEAGAERLSDLLPPAGEQRAIADLCGSMRDGKAGRFLLSVPVTQGGHCWIEAAITPAPGGAQGGFLLLGREVTDRVRRSEEDRAAQRLFAQAFMGIAAAAAIISSKGQMLVSGEAFRRLLGHDGQDDLNRDFLTLLDPACKPAFLRVLALCLAGSRPRPAPIALRRRDGKTIAAKATLQMIEASAAERVAVMTLTPDPGLEMPPQTAAADAPRAQIGVAGAVRLIGLAEVRDALGPRWPAIADRALLRAETIIKRRLGERDVVSRTPDQGFMIWFAEGSTEDNTILVAQIARQIRVALATEFTDAMLGSVGSAAVEVPFGATREGAARDAEAQLGKQLAEPVDPTQEAARTSLAAAEHGAVPNTTQMFGRGGQPLPSFYCDLPPALAKQVEHAAAVLEQECAGSFEVDALRLRCAATFARVAAERGGPQTAFVRVRADRLLSRGHRDRIFEELKRAGDKGAARLSVLLASPYEQVGATRLVGFATELKAIVRAVGLELAPGEALNPKMLRAPLSVVAFSASRLGDEDEQAELWAAIGGCHRAGAKLIARGIATAADARKLLELGVDFLCGVGPATVLAA